MPQSIFSQLLSANPSKSGPDEHFSYFARTPPDFVHFPYMPRFARAVVPQCPHHVTQRGNERRDVFFTPADREVYLGLLKHYSQMHHVQVLAFALSRNHIRKPRASAG